MVHGSGPWCRCRPWYCGSVPADLCDIQLQWERTVQQHVSVSPLFYVGSFLETGGSHSEGIKARLIPTGLVAVVFGVNRLFTALKQKIIVIIVYIK